MSASDPYTSCQFSEVSAIRGMVSADLKAPRAIRLSRLSKDIEHPILRPCTRMDEATKRRTRVRPHSAGRQT